MNDEESRERPTTDPDALAKSLEVELILKRASWQKARGRLIVWRTLSIIFLLLVIVGALAAYFFLIPQPPSSRSEAPAATRSR